MQTKSHKKPQVLANQNFTAQHYEESLHFRDWITFQKGSQYLLGHYQASSGLGLQVVKKSTELYRFKTFGFFQVIALDPTEPGVAHTVQNRQKAEQLTKCNQVTFSTPFYLVHVETGLYLSSMYDETQKHVTFDHISLKLNRSRSCVFKFKRQIKGGITKSHSVSVESTQKVQFTIAQSDSQTVKINSNLRIFNVSAQKFIQLVKGQSLSSFSSNRQSQAQSLNKSQNFYEDLMSSGSNQNKQNEKTEDSEPNIWLSYNFDYFTIRLHRRSKEYNPILLSNYDTVMIYNKFTNSYIGVKKKKDIIQVVNSNSPNEPYEDDLYKQDKNFGLSQKVPQALMNSYRIVVNREYLTPKNCTVEQTSLYCFQNKSIFSYMWKVFTRSNSVYHKQRVQQLKNSQTYPSLIKSKEIVFFQHLQSGLFMVKNTQQGQNSEPYVLCGDFQDLSNDQRDNCSRFMFRVQNLSILRYQKQSVQNQTTLSSNFKQQSFTLHPQPINISLPVTLDFQQLQFQLTKLDPYPRLHYFTYHFPKFLQSLISFLNNPKAIDDRIYIFKQKIKVMQMIYDKILCEGYATVSNQIDKGYYFLDMTVKILKIIRLKMKQYELEAVALKKQLDNPYEDSLKNKNKPNIKLGYEHNSKNTNRQKYSCHQSEHYIFPKGSNPLDQLFQLNATIYEVLRSFINRILNYLALVFGNRTMEIYDLIQEKQNIEGQDGSDLKRYKPAQNSQEDKPSAKKSQANNQNSIIIRKKQSGNASSSRGSASNNYKRNNSASSFKSNGSSMSGSGPLRNAQNMQSHINQKSTFHIQSFEKQQCKSYLLKELIKALVHLLSVEPHKCSQILKLLAVQQPYEIITWINQKLQNLQSKLDELNQNPKTSGKYFGYETVSAVVIDKSLKLHRNLQTCIFEQVYSCIRLINHIIESFNQDLEYDWSKKLKYIEDNYFIKRNSQKQAKLQKQSSKWDEQLIIIYKKRSYKFSQILSKTQSENFKRLHRWVRQSKSNDEQKRKKILKFNGKGINSYKDISGKQTKDFSGKQKKINKQRSSLVINGLNLAQSDHQIQDNSSKLSSMNKKDGDDLNKMNSKKKILSRPQHKDKKSNHISQKHNHQKQSREIFSLVEQTDKYYFFQCLKEIIKLKFINLKAKNYTQRAFLPFYNQQGPESAVKNPLSVYKDLPSLSLILQITNNLEANSLNNITSSQSCGSVNISTLNNSRFICCDYFPIDLQTNLSKVLNYGVIMGDQNTVQEYSSLLKYSQIDYLLQQSPFCLMSLQQIFRIFKSSQQNPKEQSFSKQKQMFVQAMYGLKVLFNSLQIFVSLGQWTFTVLKQIQKYSIQICQLITLYSVQSQKNTPNINQDTPQIIRSFTQRKSAEKNQQSIPYSNKQRQSFTLFVDSIISGAKDATQSMLVQLNQLFQILYIQKKRIMVYPFIHNSMDFFSAEQFSIYYRNLVCESRYLARQMPILTQMLQLNGSFTQNRPFLQNSQISSSLKSEQYRRPYLPKKLSSISAMNSSAHLSSYEPNQTLLTWPQLSPEQILIFCPKQLSLHKQTFLKTSCTIIKLKQLMLLLNTLQSLDSEQRIRNNFLVQIRQKISLIQVNLNAIVKLQGNKKVIKAFGLIQIVLTIVFSNKVLQKESIRPFLQFLIEIRMWKDTIRQLNRVLIKGNMNTFKVHPQDQMSRQQASNFLLSNIKKQQFFVIIAKYLQEKSSHEQKQILMDLISKPLLQFLDYSQAQTHQSLLQKISFVCMLIQMDSSSLLSVKFIDKLLNRQDVQLYIEALKTFKNFESFCLNIKNVKILLENKKIIQQKVYFQNSSSQNIMDNRSSKNSSIFSFGNNISSNINVNLKLKNKTSQFIPQKEEMTNQKKQEINKFVILMTVIFRIAKQDKQIINKYFNLFFSFKQVLKIVQNSVAQSANSYEMFKPLLIYLESNQAVTDYQNTIEKSRKYLPYVTEQKNSLQTELYTYFHSLNQIMSLYHLYSDELESYQSSSTFFLPFVEQQNCAGRQTHEHFNRQKIKKIASQIKNFNKKTYFWELLLWVPSYQKQEGLLVLIQRLILSNLVLFQTKNSAKKIKSRKHQLNDWLKSLQLPLNRILHSIFDNLMNIQIFLEDLKGQSRFKRLFTRIIKLKTIFLEIFPTIQASLVTFKHQKSKLSKQQQEDYQENRIIEEEDQQEAGFLSSDDKNPKSQQSYYSRQQSFQSAKRQDKYLKQSKKVQAHNMKTSSANKKITTVNQDKQKQRIYNFENSGYQFILRLSNSDKLQRFIKIFEQKQRLNQSKIKDEYKRQKSMRDQNDSISFYDKISIPDDLDAYLDDQSEDQVINDAKPKNQANTGKFKSISKPAIQTKNVHKQVQLTKKQSRSQMNYIDSMGESSNYSHHAIIVAQNMLNEDMPSNHTKNKGLKNQQSFASSNQTFKVQQRQKFLSKVAFESLHTLKEFKRADYSHFYQKLKSYKFYEVLLLLKQVLFENQSLKQTTGQKEYENQLYYQLQRHLLQFFGQNGTVKDLFQQIQNYLKNQSQKANGTQFDYRFGFQGERELMKDHRVKYEIIRKDFRCFNYSQHKPQKSYHSELIITQIQQSFNTDILFMLYERQKYQTLVELLQSRLLLQNQKRYKKITEHLQNQQETSKIVSSKSTSEKEECSQIMQIEDYPQKLQIWQLFQFLALCLDHDKLAQKPLQIDGYSDLHQGHAGKNAVNKRGDFQKKHYSRLNTRKHRLLIVHNVLKLISNDLKSSKNELELPTIRQQASYQFQNLQQNLKKYIYQLISIIEYQRQHSIDLHIENRSSAAVEIQIFEIKLLLLKLMPQIGTLFQQNHREQTHNQNPTKRTIGQMIQFSLCDCFEKLSINQSQQIGQSYQRQAYSPMNFSQQSVQNTFQKRQSPAGSQLSGGEISLLKQYLSSMSLIVQNETILESRQPNILEPTLYFTQEIIIGAINHCNSENLTSPNIQSLEIISLLTCSLTFLQVFVSSVSEIRLHYNNDSQQQTICFRLTKNSEKGYIQMRLLQKLIEFETLLYELLFNNKHSIFGNKSHTYYLKDMMSMYDTQQSKDMEIQNKYLQQQNIKTQRYIVLFTLLTESIDLFNNLSYRIKNFPTYQDDFFEQRRKFIENSNKLSLQAQKLKQMYADLNQTYGSCVINLASPRQSNTSKMERLVVFPLFKETQFVWKFQLLGLFQYVQFNQTKKNLLFAALSVFKQTLFSRRIIYEVVKAKSILCRISQISIFTCITIYIFLEDSYFAARIVEKTLLSLNCILLVVNLLQRTSAGYRMICIKKQINQLSYGRIAVSMFFMYLPFMIVISANVYSFWNIKALPFLLFLFIFNRIQRLYGFVQRYSKTIKSVVYFILANIVVIVGLQILTKLRPSETRNLNYLSSQRPLFTIEGQNFNYLSMVFQSPKNQFITDPLVILFNIWIILTVLWVMAIVSFHIIQDLKINQTIDFSTGRIRQCALCMKKPQIILEEHNYQLINRKEQLQSQKSRKTSSSIDQKEPFPYQTIDQDPVSESSQDSKIKSLKMIYESHVKQRHNIFGYLSYFSYLTYKKQGYLTEKQRVIRKKVEDKDANLYI